MLDMKIPGQVPLIGPLHFLGAYHQGETPQVGDSK